MPGKVLEVGHNDQNEIVVNFEPGQPSTAWHAVFTLEEAEQFALKLLSRVADRRQAAAIDDLARCAVCGWTLAAAVEDGCVRGNCSQRPMPHRFYAPARAHAEYGCIVSRYQR